MSLVNQIKRPPAYTPVKVTPEQLAALPDAPGRIDAQTTQKIGRDDLCYCGSRRSAKHCCNRLASSATTPTALGAASQGIIKVPPSDLPLDAPEQPQPSPTRAVVKSARSRNRAAAFNDDLAQWQSYHYGRARDDAERAAVTSEYEKRQAEGPDFTRYHNGSTFADPPKNKLDRNQKFKILISYEALVADLYKYRLPRGQSVSRNYGAVLECLLSMAVKYGRVFPSLAAIAGMVRCCTQTVLSALDWLELHGFVERIRRITRHTVAGRSFVKQTSNAYRLFTALKGLAGAVVNQQPGSFEQADGTKRHAHRYGANKEPWNLPPGFKPDGLDP